MKNFGLTDLRLVTPQCDPLDPEAVRMAVHAPELLAQAGVYSTLALALADRLYAVGTTARTRALQEVTDPAVGIQALIQSERGALVFGPEDRGLSNEELGQCHGWITLPTDPGYSSLNLAQAVGICCFLRYQALDLTPPAEGLIPASGGELTGFYTHWEETLLDIGYLLPHTSERRMAKFRRIFSRAQLTTEEVALLRGVLRQIRWAEQHQTVKEKGED